MRGAGDSSSKKWGCRVAFSVIAGFLPAEYALYLLTGHPDRNQGRAGFEVLVTGEKEYRHGKQEDDNQRDGD